MGAPQRSVVGTWYSSPWEAQVQSWAEIKIPEDTRHSQKNKKQKKVKGYRKPVY